MTDPSPTIIYAACMVVVFAVAWWMKRKDK